MFIVLREAPQWVVPLKESLKLFGPKASICNLIFIYCIRHLYANHAQTMMHIYID